MPFMKIRTSFPAAVLSVIILSLLAGLFLLIGVAHLINPDVPPGTQLTRGERVVGTIMASAVCGVGAVFLLIAIAVARGSFWKGAGRSDITRLFR